MRAHLRDFQNAISAAARISHWQIVTSAVHSVPSSLALGAVCVVEVRRAAFDTTFDIKGVDNGPAENLDTLVRIPKLVRNALLFHGLGPLARKCAAVARSCVARRVRFAGGVAADMGGVCFPE